MKSPTDEHWDRRARSALDRRNVNIADVFQRELEFDQVERFLTPEMRILEVGCGNGYSTERFRERVQHVDAFDYSEDMVASARRLVGEQNNQFFCDNLLDLQSIKGSYDLAVCVWVLINLASFEEQVEAVETLARVIRPGGRLILAEGFSEGFAELSELREQVGLPPLVPASINFYSSLREFKPQLERLFRIDETFHLGAYDYLTRVAYPLSLGAAEVSHNTDSSRRFADLARAFNGDGFEHLSRVRGFACTRV